MSGVSDEARKLYLLVEQGTYTKAELKAQLAALFLATELENPCLPSTTTNPTSTPSS